MSKLLDNKQIIHIVSEIIIIVGIVFYFTQKNKKLMNHINDLTQRIEEQEDILQKHEQMITKLSSMVEELNNRNSGFFQMDNFPKEMKVPNSKNSIPIPSPQNPFSHSTIILESVGHLRNNNKSPISQSSRVVEIIEGKDDNKDDNKVNDKVDDKFQKNIVHKKEQETKKFENIPIKKEIKKEKVEVKVEELSDEPSDEPSEEDLDAELEDELKDLD
jgi:hypothetical protein